MKKCSLFLAVTFCFVHAVMSQTATRVADFGINVPGPTYPEAALADKVAGSGSCNVHFDEYGHVDSATMTESTGSTVLDKNTVEYARKNWTGRRFQRVVVQMAYKPDDPAKRAEIIVCILTPTPPYPYQARAKNEQGSGTVEVSFDESGNAVKAMATKSTGIDILDQNTVTFILAQWKSSGGKTTTITLPFEYRLP